MAFPCCPCDGQHTRTRVSPCDGPLSGRQSLLFSCSGWASSVLGWRQTVAHGRSLSCQGATCTVCASLQWGLVPALLTGRAAGRGLGRPRPQRSLVRAAGLGRGGKGTLANGDESQATACDPQALWEDSAQRTVKGHVCLLSCVLLV